MRLRKIVIIGPESTGKSTLCEGLANHFGTDWVPEYARAYLLTHGKNYQYGELLTIARGQLALEEKHARGLVERWRARGDGRWTGKDEGTGRRAGKGGGAGRESGMDTDKESGMNAGRKRGMDTDRADREGDETDPILFIDTDMYVMKVWSEFVFGRCDAWILDQVASRRYDGYLLCRTDLPWTADELREYPDDGPREQLFHMYKDCMVNQSTPWREIGGCEEDRLTAGIAAVKEIVALRSMRF